MTDEQVSEQQEKTVLTDLFDGLPEPIIKKEETIIEEKVIEKEEIKDDKKEVIVDEKKESVHIEEKKEDKPETIVKKEESQQFKYANEESEKIHKLLLDGKKDEVLDILNQQKKIDKLISATVDKDSAVEIIKLQLEMKLGKNLTQDQINHKFNKTYGVPKEPVQKTIEGDEEFEERMNEWKEKVLESEKDLIIDAEIAKSELEKFKIDLQLPDIQNTVKQKELSPEDLAKQQDEVKLFLKNADEALSKFEGFNVSYKDAKEGIDIQTTYKLSDEEKTNVAASLKFLAENDYDSNSLFAKRWVNEDKTFNFEQMAKDIAALETEDKRGLKFVADATAKAKLHFLKSKKNIDLSVDSNGQLQLEDKSTEKANEDAIWQ